LHWGYCYLIKKINTLRKRADNSVLFYFGRFGNEVFNQWF
jgi:hypothetical protein